MDVTPLIPEGRQIIQSYSDRGFRVSGTTYQTPIIVFPTQTSVWNVSANFTEVTENDFSPLTDMANDLDVVLLGTGAHGEFFPPALRQTLKDKGLSVESMDTGAACRTYNVLMAEGRRVAAALLPLQEA